VGSRRQPECGVGLIELVAEASESLSSTSRGYEIGKSRDMAKAARILAGHGITCAQYCYSYQWTGSFIETGCFEP